MNLFAVSTWVDFPLAASRSPEDPLLMVILWGFLIVIALVCAIFAKPKICQICKQHIKRKQFSFVINGHKYDCVCAQCAQKINGRIAREAANRALGKKTRETDLSRQLRNLPPPENQKPRKSRHVSRLHPRQRLW